MKVAREAVALLLRDLDDPQALRGELLRQLHVLERHTGRSRERLDEPLVVLLKGALVVVHGLKHAEPAAVACVDGRDEHRAGPEPAARVDARVEARVLIRGVDAQELTGARDLGREAAPVERETDLGQLALREHARPELVLAPIDHVERGALAVEHPLRGVHDPRQDTVDVGLERELAL